MGRKVQFATTISHISMNHALHSENSRLSSIFCHGKPLGAAIILQTKKHHSFSKNITFLGIFKSLSKNSKRTKPCIAIFTVHSSFGKHKLQPQTSKKNLGSHSLKNFTLGIFQKLSQTPKRPSIVLPKKPSKHHFETSAAAIKQI